MTAMLGTDKIPLLSNKCKLALLFMLHSHAEDHMETHCSGPGNMSGLCLVKLAEKVCRECPWCKHLNRILCQPKMADLPPQIF